VDRCVVPLRTEAQVPRSPPVRRGATASTSGRCTGHNFPRARCGGRAPAGPGAVPKVASAAILVSALAQRVSWASTSPASRDPSFGPRKALRVISAARVRSGLIANGMAFCFNRARANHRVAPPARMHSRSADTRTLWPQPVRVWFHSEFGADRQRLGFWYPTRGIDHLGRAERCNERLPSGNVARHAPKVDGFYR
jgi:hypothetical protein